MQQLTNQHLSAHAAQGLLEAIPDRIRAALVAYATELEYPVEAVIEMAIASFLDEDALSFSDCKPMTARGNLKMLDKG